MFITDIKIFCNIVQVIIWIRTVQTWENWISFPFAKLSMTPGKRNACLLLHLRRVDILWVRERTGQVAFFVLLKNAAIAVLYYCNFYPFRAFYWRWKMEVSTSLYSHYTKELWNGKEVDGWTDVRRGSPFGGEDIKLWRWSYVAKDFFYL